MIVRSTEVTLITLNTYNIGWPKKSPILNYCHSWGLMSCIPDFGARFSHPCFNADVL